MRAGARLFLLVLSCLLLLAASPDTEQPLSGYSAASSRIERDWEAKFRAIPEAAEPARLHAAARRASAPRRLALRQGQRRMDAGQVQGVGPGRQHRDLRRPVSHAESACSWRLVEPTKFTAKLQEPALAIDPTSNQQAEQLPTYNAYSADGDVTAPLVYVNYGIPDDYEKLERLGVSVKGAIVIARYGNSWRGIKPKVAAEHGAVGCLIYSDPADDGYVQGDVFPAGRVAPARRRAARQRDGHAALSRRSAHARSRRHERRQASRSERRSRPSPKFRCCRFPTPTRSRCWRR